MAGAASNDQALSLLATVNNHGDLAVKLSSLKQAKDLLLSLEPSGSAHRGPASTPAEVLITDACSACFEQRTVFTQALAKALNQMVDQTPLPLLFMRTVIQAIDDFPSLVDFVMEILSKLVRKQGTSDVLYVLTAGVENAKPKVWIPEMRVTDTATFFPCIVTTTTPAT
ncbi:hypothetical protein DVH24_033423 [Malus domestica]|uniref:Symplekin C-terminal domain-containing protein n=1 Tax=Malus domestica TaxID=3750 RepID=A0A498JCK2_MALDO|nr:hypothetical protein DVH24_033423 [Malus domestica]